MTIVESHLSARAFGRKLEEALLADLARVIVVILALYLIVRVQDLMARDALRFIYPFTYQSILFLGEVITGVIVPFLLLMTKSVRMNPKGLFYSAALVLVGFVANRLNTAITSMEQWPADIYVPSWQEFMITIGLATGGFVVFALVARYFDVFQGEESVGLNVTV
jgi:Ni/Fe-hydrogenase subunit HybB-like protein